MLSPALLAAGCAGTSPGAAGIADFSWQGCLLGDCGLAHNPIAAGAAASIVYTLSSGGSVTSVDSSDKTVATFLLAQGKGVVSITAGKAGTADLLLLDGAGGVIDRGTVTVAAVDGIEFTRGWPGTGPAVMAGATVTLSATSQSGGQALVGHGGIQFTTTGTLRAASAPLVGDGVGFIGDVGTGAVRASAGDYAQTLTITVLDKVDKLTPSVTSLRFAAASKGALSLTGFNNMVPVFGTRCTWTADGLTFLDLSSPALGGSPSAVYQVSGPAGVHQPRCTVGATSVTIPVTIQ